MTTNNAVNVILAGQSGTGTFVGSTSPSIVTPALGTPSSGVLTNATGDQIGTTTNDDAATGHLGEYISASVLIGSPISVTTATTKTITSISLTAGDWDVAGTAYSLASVSAVISKMYGGISIVNNTLPTEGADNGISLYGGTLVANQDLSLPIVSTRISIAGTTTVYLVVQITFTNTCSTYGFIGARRAR